MYSELGGGKDVGGVGDGLNCWYDNVANVIIGT